MNVENRENTIEREKLESLEMLAGGIAHDFNNLLTGILVNLSYAMDEAADNESRKGSLELVKKSALQAASLCEQMLSLAGGKSLELAPARLIDLVQEGLELVEHLIPDNVTIDCQSGKHPSNIEADAVIVRQVVVNLVMNAIEAIGDKPGKIELRTSLKTFDRQFLSRLDGDLMEGVYVSLTLKDSGCGMSAATTKRIFEPFFSTKEQGRGLGLAMVQGTIRSHRGGVGVESSQDKGTTVTILFPLAAPSPVLGSVVDPKTG